MRRRAFMGSALALSGCGVIPRLPDQTVLYSHALDVDPASRRPLVTIPGILGSRLRIGRDGGFVWGGPKRLSLDPNGAEATARLCLPMGDGTQPLNTLIDDVRPAGVLRRANTEFLGTTIHEEVYDGLVQSLNAGGYEFSRTEEEERARRGENPGSLEYPYDWRRDIVEAAHILDDFLNRKAEQVHRVRKQRYGQAPDPDAIRFDLIGHSMGALVLRYYMMYGTQDLPDDGSLPELDWSGARRVACAIFVAPPNLGSVSAFTSLLNGRDLGLLLPNYPPALLGSHVSLYQLMARPRHGRVRLGSPDGPAIGNYYDAAMWEEYGWGLLDPTQDEVLAWKLPGTASRAGRRAIARRYLDRVLTRAEQFHRAIDRAGTAPASDMFLVVGTGLDTPATAVRDAQTGRTEEAVFEEGDGTVLRASALSDERQGDKNGNGPRRPIHYRTVLLLPGEHVTITRNRVFADNLLYWLLGSPRRRTAPVRRDAGADAGTASTTRPASMR